MLHNQLIRWQSRITTFILLLLISNILSCVSQTAQKSPTIKIPETSVFECIRQYKRLNVHAIRPPWTKTDISVREGDKVLIFASGAATIGSGARFQNMPPYNLLQLKIGTEGTPEAAVLFNSLRYFKPYEVGKLMLAVNDWGNPSQIDLRSYQDNTGAYLVDLFVVVENKEKLLLEAMQVLSLHNSEDLVLKNHINKFIELHRNLFFTDVEVTSSPSNAQVYLDGFYRGKTPIMLKDLKVHHTYEICLKKNGYPDYYNSLSPKKSKNLFAELKKEYDRISAVPEERNEIIKGKTPPKILITSHDTSRGVKVVENKKKIKLIGKVIGENGIVEIIVNGQEAHFDNLGNFETSVYLSIGENKIDVSAMDRFENRAYKTFTIIRQGSFASNKKSNEIVTSGQYYALVIGNNNYKYLRKLETATRDAQIVDEALKTLFNFETTLLIDVSRNEIIKALNNFRNKLKRNDNFLIYYAGHGVFDKAANKAYWLPVDAQNNDDTNWIIADTVTSNIRRISSNHILIVSDSCYSGTFTRMSKLDISSAEQRNRFLKRMQSKKSRTLLASGGNEPVSDIGGEGHSVFAKAFIKGLRSIGQNEFTAEELYYQYIKESVAGNSEQTPEYNIIRNSGHEGGDFVFIKIK